MFIEHQTIDKFSAIAAWLTIGVHLLTDDGDVKAWSAIRSIQNIIWSIYFSIFINDASWLMIRALESTISALNLHPN